MNSILFPNTKPTLGFSLVRVCHEVINQGKGMKRSTFCDNTSHALNPQQTTMPIHRGNYFHSQAASRRAPRGVLHHRDIPPNSVGILPRHQYHRISAADTCTSAYPGTVSAPRTSSRNLLSRTRRAWSSSNSMHLRSSVERTLPLTSPPPRIGEFLQQHPLLVRPQCPGVRVGCLVPRQDEPVHKSWRER